MRLRLFLYPFVTIYNSIRIIYPFWIEQSIDLFKLFRTICFTHFQKKVDIGPFCNTPQDFNLVLIPEKLSLLFREIDLQQ